MLIRLGYDIQFDTSPPVPMIALLHVHPSREKDLIEPDQLHTDPLIDVTDLHRQLRQPLRKIRCPAGSLRLTTPHSYMTPARRRSQRAGTRNPSRRLPDRISAICSIAAIAKMDRLLQHRVRTVRPALIRAGRACRPSATGFTARSLSVIPMLDPPRPPSTSTLSASAFAATFSTSPSRSVAP